ncbi:MAG: hypothetical protein WAK55_28395, partial [Xanthobacteraceae bacterium]
DVRFVPKADSCTAANLLLQEIANVRQQLARSPFIRKLKLSQQRTADGVSYISELPTGYAEVPDRGSDDARGRRA